MKCKSLVKKEMLPQAKVISLIVSAHRGSDGAFCNVGTGDVNSYPGLTNTTGRQAVCADPCFFQVEYNDTTVLINPDVNFTTYCPDFVADTNKYPLLDTVVNLAAKKFVFLYQSATYCVIDRQY